MLSQKYSRQDLSRMIASQADWHPYPTVHEPEAWGSIPGTVRRHLLEAGDSRLNFAWPLLPATLFLDYSRTGARTPYQIPYYERRYALADLVLAECVQGQGRYLDDIVNGIWVICEETYWGVPAHVWVQAAGNTLPDRREPTVDLFAAETAALLAWTHYLLNDMLDTVSPLVRPRMEQEIRERILEVNRTRSDFPWQGNLGSRRVNNWNPWICSNWLTCILALETDDRQRAADIFLLLQTVDRFIDPYPADGGCDEGPNYWGRAGASLYENLELLYGATAGQIDVFQESLIQEIGKFIYRAHIAEDYYLNFADASALMEPEALLVYLFGQRIADPVMQAYGTWLTDRQQILTHGLTEGEGVRKQSSLGRALPALFALTEVAAQTGTAPLLRDVWLPEIEVMSSRDQEGSAVGFYVAIKGGHNAESHNHNDIGNFVVYRDGLPLLVDAGVEEYTAKTFGPNRYDIWTMQSAYHNLLPTLDGVQQLPGAAYKAASADFRGDDEVAAMTVDFAPAYGPEAGIQRWLRTIYAGRGRSIDINDQYQLVQRPDRMVLSLLTPSQVQVRQDRQVIPSNGSGDSAPTGVISTAQLVLNSVEFMPGRNSASGVVYLLDHTYHIEVEAIPITDTRMQPIWGTSLNRVVLTLEHPEPTGQLGFRIT